MYLTIHNTKKIEKSNHDMICVLTTIPSKL